MLIKRFLLLLFLILPLIDGCAHSKPAKTSQKFDDCQLISARAGWRQESYEAQYSALLATCAAGGHWRLLLKADWGTTAIDLTFLNGKLHIITKPAPLSAQVVEELAQKLTQELRSGQVSNQLVIDLPKPAIILELSKLSERQMPEEQAKNLFNL